MNKPIKENLKIVLDFVERWNKQDQESDVAQACVELEEDVLIMDKLDEIQEDTTSMEEKLVDIDKMFNRPLEQLDALCKEAKALNNHKEIEKEPSL